MERIEGDHMLDHEGTLWKVTGWWCMACLYPLQSPEEIANKKHAGCELTS